MIPIPNNKTPTTLSRDPKTVNNGIRKTRNSALLIAVIGTLGTAANNLDLIGLDGLPALIELEGDVANQEGPDFIAEAVSIEGTLDVFG